MVSGAFSPICVVASATTASSSASAATRFTRPMSSASVLEYWRAVNSISIALGNPTMWDIRWMRRKP